MQGNAVPSFVEGSAFNQIIPRMDAATHQQQVTVHFVSGQVYLHQGEALAAAGVHARFNKGKPVEVLIGTTEMDFRPWRQVIEPEKDENPLSGRFGKVVDQFFYEIADLIEGLELCPVTNTETKSIQVYCTTQPAELSAENELAPQLANWLRRMSVKFRKAARSVERVRDGKALRKVLKLIKAGQNARVA